MSIDFMSMVFKDESLKSTEKLVLLAIADNSNDEGLCYPSMSTLQKKTSLGRAAVNRNLTILREKGYLWRVHRARKKGGRSSNLYLIFPVKNYPNLDPDYKAKFEKLSTENESQSIPKILGSQSIPKILGGGSQSIPKILESEPSLKRLFNHQGFCCLNDEEKSLFLEYLKLRKKMKLKTTDGIEDRLLKKYHAFGRDVLIIENAINSNWRDFYEPTKNASGSGFGKKQSTAQVHHDTLKDIAREADEREMGERVIQ